MSFSSEKEVTDGGGLQMAKISEKMRRKIRVDRQEGRVQAGNVSWGGGVMGERSVTHDMKDRRLSIQTIFMDSKSLWSHLEFPVIKKNPSLIKSKTSSQHKAYHNVLIVCCVFEWCVLLHKLKCVPSPARTPAAEPSMAGKQAEGEVLSKDSGSRTPVQHHLALRTVSADGEPPFTSTANN